MKNEKIIMKDNQIIINGNVLPYKIQNVVELDDGVIVRVEPDIGHVYRRNIFCFTKSGELKWQIQEGHVGNREFNSYLGMIISPDGDSFVEDWAGYRYLLDLSNGSIKKNAYMRFVPHPLIK